MFCPIRYNPAKYDECYIDCPWACITPNGFGCAIAFIAMSNFDNIGINLESLPTDVTEESNDENDMS